MPVSTRIVMFLVIRGSRSLNLHLPRLHPGRGDTPRYHLFKMVIFQPAMFVYWRVDLETLTETNHHCSFFEKTLTVLGDKKIRQKQNSSNQIKLYNWVVNSSPNQLMLNCWFGARWLGILWVQLSNIPFHKGIPGIQTTGPQTNN